MMRQFLRKTSARLFKLALLLALIVLMFILLGRAINPSLSSLMVIRLVQGYGISAEWRDIDKVSASLPHAILTSEDNHFCTHKGIDWAAVETVIDDLNDGKNPRGASTLTMQVAKNLFLWPWRSYLRKGLEVPLAYVIDFVWPKKRIMEVYLNIAEWGPGIYGAEAAAQHHFKRSANKLTKYQAALLAASLPAPNVRTAGKPGPVTRRVASRILKRIGQTRGLFDCIKQ